MNLTYQTKADPDVAAFTLFYIDRHPYTVIADTLQMTIPQAEAAVAREYEKRKKQDRLQISVRKGSIDHVVVATEDRVCSDHGPYLAEQWAIKQKVEAGDDRPLASFLKPFWGNCPQCDRIWQNEANAKDSEIKLGRCNRDAARKESRIRAGIPDRYHDANLFNWSHGMDQQDRVWRYAMDFCSGFDIVLQTGRSVAFTGAPGTGKTRLASSMLAHVLDKGGTGLYTTVMSMLGRIKDTYNHKATETEREVIEAFRAVDLLVIDEVGKQVDSNYDQTQLFRILDLRYQFVKPTIMVSNLTMPGLQQFLTAPVVDRLREAGGMILVFDWASQRSSRRKNED